MIVAKLQGGLGNQMFQYAMARALASWYGTEFALDHEFLEYRSADATHVFRDYALSVFQIDPSRASKADIRRFFQHNRFKWLRPWRTGTFYFEPRFAYSPQVFELKLPLYLDGYWQSEKYFERIREQLRIDFQFRDEVLPESRSLLEQIASVDAVCLNVRRTDFLTNAFHAVCTESFYEAGISIMFEKLANPNFFVFTDDITWCEKVFGRRRNFLVVGHSHSGFQFANYLQLMTACRHFIIPNSSFAWWAVWLANRRDAIVVAPDRWFNDPDWPVYDLVMPHWILIPPEGP